MLRISKCLFHDDKDCAGFYDSIVPIYTDGKKI